MYNPILCMNVPDSVKTKDAMFNVVYKTDSGTMQALLKAENEKEAENKVRVREGNKFKSLIGVKKMGDSAIDKAIRNCDESYPELTISNAKVGNKYAWPGGWIKLTKVWKMTEKEMKENDLIYPWRFEGISDKGRKEGAALTH